MEPKQLENNKTINNNKSNIFPIIPFQKKKRKSVQLGLDQLKHIVDNYSFKSRLKNVEGNKFNKIPKNTKLTNLSLILINKEHPPQNKDKNYYLNMLKNSDQSLEKEEENAYIKKKLKEMNERVASIQAVQKRNKKKGKTIKEKSSFINVLKKSTKLKRKRKTSFNKDDDKSKNSGSKKKKKKRKFNSSSSIINVNDKDKEKDKKAKEINNIRHIINAEEKVKKLYLISEQKESEEKKENDEQVKDSSAKMSDSNSIKGNKEMKEIKEIKINNNKNNSNNNINKDSNNNINNNKKEKEKNSVKELKKEVTNINNNININYIETKNNYEVKHEEKKENKKKKRKFFCFCCLTKEEDNSFDFD